MQLTAEEFKRFVSKFTIGDDCWIWHGARNPKGYGHLNFRGRTINGHKMSYQLLAGDVPSGYHLDHFVCKNPSCINPSHLEPVTPAENIHRGNTGKHWAQKRKANAAEQ